MRVIHSRTLILATASLFTLATVFGGAIRAQQPCSVTPVLRTATAAHTFTAQQEQALGDVEAEWVETTYRVVHDTELSSHLNMVLGRILSQFPPNQLRVRVILIDAPEADAFSAGPERIYITRKMVAMLNNDDELAGLLGHEMGHILTHQNAILVAHLFHDLLGVNAVSDRKDISDKFGRMLDSINRDDKVFRKAAQIIQRQEETHQYEADRVALYAAAAAGFSPQAFAEFFDRFAETHGSTGNLLTDFLEATTSNEKRLREIHKSLKLLPQPCREIAAAAPSADFLTWQAAVISYPDWARR